MTARFTIETVYYTHMRMTCVWGNNMTSLHTKAQAIIDNLYMYITLVDNELYINGVKHEATVVSVYDDYTSYTTAIGFLTMWCQSRAEGERTLSWSQVSPALGAPDTILHSAICYNIFTVDCEIEDLQKQSSWPEICIPEL